MIKFAERMSRLGTESAFEVLARAKAIEATGKEVIHLEIGEPDFDTPDNIRESGAKAIWDGYTHYCPAQGIPELRQAIADVVGKDKNLDIKPEQVVVTPGAKPIMFFSMLALVDEGDEVIYPNPGFPIYESVIEFLGAKAVPIKLEESKEFCFDADELGKLITPKTKMMIFNSPQNPTGGVLCRDDLEAIAKLAREHDIWVLTDEVYSKLLYEGEHLSIAALPGMREHTIVLDGYSKTYAMTGWRLGYGIMPEKLAAALTKLQINATSCTCTFSQVAGVEGLRGDQSASEKMVREFKKRRDVIVDGLNRIPGISCLRPKGAFYVFPNIQGTGIPARELADLLLNEAGVAVLPGTAFGKYGEGYLRLSYANSIENINKALGLIERTVAKVKK
ncbi:MAG: pyridoxal phosphate-dependent aminotransferase [Candidatus Eisenbacteria bacterium]